MDEERLAELEAKHRNGGTMSASEASEILAEIRRQQAIIAEMLGKTKPATQG